MPRTLPQIIASARALLHNRGAITLGSASIRTEDLRALCDAAQRSLDGGQNDATRFTTLSDQD